MYNTEEFWGAVNTAVGNDLASSQRAWAIGQYIAAHCQLRPTTQAKLGLADNGSTVTIAAAIKARYGDNPGAPKSQRLSEFLAYYAAQPSSPEVYSAMGLAWLTVTAWQTSIRTAPKPKPPEGAKSGPAVTLIPEGLGATPEAGPVDPLADVYGACMVALQAGQSQDDLLAAVQQAVADHMADQAVAVHVDADPVALQPAGV